MENYQKHTGVIISKHRDYLGRYILTIDAGEEKVTVFASKAVYKVNDIGKVRFINHCGKKLKNISSIYSPEEASIWNRFIDEIVSRDLGDMNLVQKNAAIAFRYDAEMNSGGHSGFFDCRPGNVENEDVKKALHEVGAKAFIPNFEKACTSGINDDYVKTDDVFYDIYPPLTDIVMDYVLKHKSEIFKV